MNTLVQQNSNNVFLNVCLAIIYAFVFVYAYINFLFLHFDYAGFNFQERTDNFILLSVLIAAAPILVYRGYKSISSFICVFIYMFLYVPIVLTFGLGSSLPLDEVIKIQITFLLSMTLLLLSDRFKISNVAMIKTRFNLFQVVLYSTAFGTLYMMFMYRSNLKLVGFEDVYELRAENDTIGGDLFTRYFSSWLSTVLVPICLAYGLVAKKYVYFIVGSACCLIFYMATASKGTLLFPVIYLLLNVLFGGNRLYKMYAVLIISLSALITWLVYVNEVGSVSFIITSLLMMRTIGNGGMLTMYYNDYFSQHEYTYYSHINVVNLFTHSYPYGDLILGQVVGKEYWADDMNANANFWATDGIAALGVLGVPIITFVFFLIFVIANAFTVNYNKRFLALVFIPFIYTLLNQSIFSTMWSGGGFFLLVFFSFKNRATEEFE